MGGIKQGDIEAQERGWYIPDTHVCADCVSDDFLKSLIENNIEENTCCYCGRKSGEAIAAPTEVIMEAIADTASYYFNDPTSAGVPWADGEPIIESIDTGEVLETIAFDCHDGLRDDIIEAFNNWGWVRAAGGHWLSLHPHEKMSLSWRRFTYAVKHETRYFFSGLKSDEPDQHSPTELLKKIGELVDELLLTSRLPAGMLLYRVRERNKGENWQINAKEMGPPPSEKARAGRMNPAGISYFYLAHELETALAEVRLDPPYEAVSAQFLVRRDLTVIDLCQKITLPSIFDNELRDRRESLLFIADFIATISKPVKKDGREHIDYVPSQVVSEFFANVFRNALGEKIHGMAYPSSVHPGGKNVVLFPTGEFCRGFDSLMEYQSGETVA